MDQAGMGYFTADTITCHYAREFGIRVLRHRTRFDSGFKQRLRLLGQLRNDCAEGAPKRCKKYFLELRLIC